MQNSRLPISKDDLVMSGEKISRDSLMSNNSLRIHVLYESSSGGLPHGCSVIRLLRPLSHPSIQSYISLTHGLDIPNQPVDVLIIERFWDYTCDWQRHVAMLQSVRKQGTKIIYEIDDDLLDVNWEVGGHDWPADSQKMWLRQMVRFADGVIVSTKQLAGRLATLNPRIEIVENALDERLFEQSRKNSLRKPDGIVVFGYMGTFTHLGDLISIIQPVRGVLEKYRDSVRFEVVGVGDSTVLQAAFAGLPVSFLSVPAQAVLYENFTSFMQENIRWDFGIAPLIDSVFTRSKSDIKFLDYGVQGIPGIFSDVPAYNKTVKHLVNGILASDNESWTACLEKMILDKQLRSVLAARSHEEIWRERMLKTTATKWVEALNKLALGAQAPKLKLAASSTLKLANIPLPLSRNEKVLYGCNLQGIGLEIGASYCPVAPKKAGYRVEVLDHADAATLKEKYQGQNVEVSNIEEVDYVWSGEPLHVLTGKENYYDWIVASHVIEHTPDFVSFLQQCEIMLKPGGLLCLAVPDHRYCFDVFRPASTPGEVIQAYLEKRRRHSLAAIWDHFSMITKKGETVSWFKGHSGEYNLIHPNLDDARTMLARAQESSDYIDVHNWRFTPSSFKLIVNDIGLLGYTFFSTKTFFETEGCEFITQLQKGVTVNFSKNEREKLIKETLKESLDLASWDTL